MTFNQRETIIDVFATIISLSLVISCLGLSILIVNKIVDKPEIERYYYNNQCNLKPR